MDTNILCICRNIRPSYIKRSWEKPVFRLKLRGTSHFTFKGYETILIYHKDTPLFLGIADTGKIPRKKYIVYTVHVQAAAPLQSDISIGICR